MDTEDTGKKLLKNGKLRKRVTIIPLNKIARGALDPRVVQAAEDKVGAENVSLALSLVGYGKDLDPAMSYVFGGTLVCRDSESAKTVTFSQDIKARSVTLEGDVFDPSGTLTGLVVPGSLTRNRRFKGFRWFRSVPASVSQRG